MKFCDVTIAYNDRSGGIRTYIDEKRRFIENNTNHEHLLIVPGERNGTEIVGRSKIVSLEGPLLPKQNAYRFFRSPARIRNVLTEELPDVVELGSYYMEPWAAFSYRRRMRESGRTCLVGGYFHTDVAEAYVAAPLRAAAHSRLEDVSEALSTIVVKIADVAAAGAEHYIRYIFEHCDIAMAAAPAQASRLNEYGVDRVRVAPMGVDLDVFSPGRRSQSVRILNGASPETLVLVYAGRLSSEKHVLMLVDAIDCLPPTRDVQLWMIGDGPLRADVAAAALRNPSVRLLPYESDRIRFAKLLASADLYVTAGPHETFALSVIEAQASGLPVIGVDAGALKERVPPGLGYLGPVDDPEIMSANILRACAERAAIGARARRHVETHFSWNAAFRRLLAFYESAYSRDDARLPVSSDAAVA